MPRPVRRALLLLLLGLVAGRQGDAAPAAAPAVEIVGTAFRIALADGRVLADDGLVGVVLETADTDGRPLTVRVDGYRRDPLDPSGETVLYDLSTPDPATGAWTSLCDPGPDGTRAGFPLAGAWTAAGEHVAAPGVFGITCTSGAIGKCVRFGYRPWRTAPDGRSLWAYHQACVRALRADYCGDGRPHTRDGTPIDLYDRLGIEKDEPAPGMSFEAAWGPDGAACVRRTRLLDVLGTDALATECPRLAGHLGGACDEGVPALLYVRSHGRQRRRSGVHLGRLTMLVLVRRTRPGRRGRSRTRTGGCAATCRATSTRSATPGCRRSC